MYPYKHTLYVWHAEIIDPALVSVLTYPVEDNQNLPKIIKQNRTIFLWLATITVSAIVPYILSLGGGFALDDHYLIVTDPLAHSITRFHETFFTDFLRGFLGDDIAYYRPLVTISYQANYTLFGPNPFAFRLTNILLNLIVALMTFVLARRFTKSLFAAGVAGVVFCTLPSHAESVAWVSGRTDVMSCLFMLGSFMAFIANYHLRPRFNWPLALLCSILFSCALLSKENALVLPVLFAGYIWIFGDSIKRKELLKWILVLLPPLIIWLVLRKHVVGVTLDNHLFVKLQERILGVGLAYIAYLRMLFIPREVCIVYDVFPIGVKYPIIALAAWLVPIGLIVLSVWARRRMPIISFGVFWIFITLLPVSNILPTSGPLPSERFVYLASVGSSLILGWLAWRMYEFRPKSMGIWHIIAAVIICWYVILSAMFAAQGGEYYTSNINWARDVAATKTRFIMFRAAAARYLAQEGYLKEAVGEYEAVLDLGSEDPSDYVSLARISRWMGKISKAENILLYARNALKVDAGVEYELGIVYAESGNIKLAANAFENAVRIKPKFINAWRNLGKAQLKLNRYNDAFNSYSRVFQLPGSTLNDRIQIGLAHKGLNNKEKAASEFRYVINKAPDSGEAKIAAEELKSLGL